MPRWSKSNLNGKKAQFFIISTVIVAVSLASVSSLFRVYSKTDLSRMAELKESGFFRNTKESVKDTIDSSSCPDELPRNLKELEKVMEEKALKGGTDLNITYYQFCPTNVSIELKSPNIIIRDEFQYS